MKLSKLTVVIRDESPLQIQEPCTYRSVSVLLTSEQQEELKLKCTGTYGIGTRFERVEYEKISQCFLEEA